MAFLFIYSTRFVIYLKDFLGNERLFFKLLWKENTTIWAKIVMSVMFSNLQVLLKKKYLHRMYASEKFNDYN